MKKIKETVFLIVLFIIFAISGFIFRNLWFFTVQKKIVEETFIYKPLKEAKGGGKTPQEAWIGYLTALEKGDIDLALEYVWPEERIDFRKTLETLKRAGLLERYAKNHSKNLMMPNKKYEDLEKDETALLYEYINEKDVELAIRSDFTQQAAMERWEELGTSTEPLTIRAIFKFNPYTKKWMIKH